MKKMILSAALMMTAFLSQASVGGPAHTNMLQQTAAQQSSIQQVPHPVYPVTSHVTEDKECSVTMKGTIDLGAFEAEISCTTTAVTCQEATTLAISCVKAAIKTARTILL